jgi:hypothetical protein
MFDEKNQSQKISWHCPFNLFKNFVDSRSFHYPNTQEVSAFYFEHSLRKLSKNIISLKVTIEVIVKRPPEVLRIKISKN